MASFKFKNELSWMDVVSISLGIGGVLYAVFSIEAGVNDNGKEIEYLKEADARIEAKHDSDNNKVIEQLEKLEQQQQRNYERTDEKLDAIREHLMRN